MGQVVTIGTDGSVEGLQVKPGKGFDLRKLGHAAIERASEIVWSEPSQAWRIQVLCRKAATVLDPEHGHYIGAAVTLERYRLALGEEPRCLYKTTQDGALLFEEYEDAVTVEIAVLDALRKKGALH